MVAWFLGAVGAGRAAGGTAFKEHGTQHVFKEGSTKHISSSRNNSASGIMGYGGALTLVNGSPHEWTLSSQNSYQMDTWKWPNVAAGRRLPVKTAII